MYPPRKNELSAHVLLACCQLLTIVPRYTTPVRMSLVHQQVWYTLSFLQLKSATPGPAVVPPQLSGFVLTNQSSSSGGSENQLVASLNTVRRGPLDAKDSFYIGTYFYKWNDPRYVGVCHDLLTTALTDYELIQKYLLEYVFEFSSKVPLCFTNNFLELGK